MTDPKADEPIRGDRPDAPTRSGSGRRIAVLAAVGTLAAGALGVGVGLGIGLSGERGTDVNGAERVAEREAPVASASAGAVPVAAAAPQPAAASGTADETPFEAHAGQGGMDACAGVYAALGDGLTAGSRYSLRSAWSETAPGGHPVEGFVGLQYETEAYAGPAAGYVFAAPGAAQSCQGAMVRVAPYPMACDEIPSILPEGSTRLDELGAVALFALGDGGDVLLLPVGEGCAVVSVQTAAQTPATVEGEGQ